jgi:hypothetical protein
MRIFWRRGDDLERDLVAHRPEPRRDFLLAVVSRIEGHRRRRPARSPLRLGLAVAVSTAMLVALASFGALGYAASGVTHAVKSAAQVVSPSSKEGPSSAISSARAQYLVDLCFHNHTIRVDSHAVNALIAAGAKPGACSGGAFRPATARARMCFKGVNVVVAKKDVVALTKIGFTPGFCKK